VGTKAREAIQYVLRPALQGYQSKLSADTYGRKLEKVEERDKLEDFQWDLHLLMLYLISNTLYPHDKILFTQALKAK